MRPRFYLDIADQMGWEKPKPGPCAKTRVFCTITATDGEQFVGENWCAWPQDVCPREPGEDYTKCSTICEQIGHAEVDAVRLAGEKAKGATAVLRGHTYACRACQEALFGAGVVWLSVAQGSAEGAAPEKPPVPDVAEATRPDEQRIQPDPRGNWGQGPGINGSQGGDG